MCQQKQTQKNVGKFSAKRGFDQRRFGSPNKPICILSTTESQLKSIESAYRTFFIAASESEDVHTDVKDEEAAENVRNDEVPHTVLKIGAKYVEKIKHIVHELRKGCYARGKLQA